MTERFPISAVLGRPRSDTAAVVDAAAGDDATAVVDIATWSGTITIVESEELRAQVERVGEQVVQQFRRHMQRMEAALLGGWATANEVRAEMGMEPVCGFSELDLQRRNEAIVRGEKLLREWLSPAQLVQYDAHRHFEVIGGDTGHRYRIRIGSSFNVTEFDQAGEETDRLCFAPAGHLVYGDIMLAQKIALEHNEIATLKIANRRYAHISANGGFLLPDELAEYVRDFFSEGGRRGGRQLATGGTVRSDRPDFWAMDQGAVEYVHPRSWMAQWGGLGEDLARARRQDWTSRAARRARR